MGVTGMADREKVMRGAECCTKDVYDPFSCEECPYLGHKPTKKGCISVMLEDVIALLKGQEPRILSLGEAIEGKNGLEIDPYVFVEIKGREDIFIGSVNDASHYNYPDLSFGVRECFQINRSFPASKIYFNTDYMKTVRFWTSRPTEEQRKAVEWNV